MRVVAVTAGALLLAAALVVGGMNLVFATPLFGRLVSANPITLDVHYRRGWTLLPGRIHATELSIRGRDTNVEWILRIDEVTFDVSLWALLQRRFQASRIRGHGVSLRLRSRITGQAVTPRSIADLPSIEGFGEVPLRPFQQCGLDEWSDDHYRLWTVHLVGVVAEDVREVWIDDERFVGHATVTGGFYLKPVRSARIGPIHGEIHAGSFRRGAVDQIVSLSGTTDVEVGAFDPRVTHGKGVLHRLSLGLDATGRATDFAHLPFGQPERGEVHGAVDVQRLVLAMRNGLISDGSRLVARAARASASWEGHRLSAGIAVTARVSVTRRGRGTAFRALVEDLDVDGATLRAPRIDLAGSAMAPDASRPLAGLHLTVSSDRIEIPAVRALSRYLPAGFPLVVREGRVLAEGQVDLSLAERRLRGRARVVGERCRIQVGQTDWGGDLRADLDVGDWRMSSGALPALAFTALLDGSVSNPSLVARVNALAKLNVSEKQPRVARGRIDVVVPSARIQLGKSRLTGDLRILVPVVSEEPGVASNFNLSGASITLANVVAPDGPPVAPNWRGYATLSPATVHLDGGPPRFQAQVALRATDADPFLAVLVRQSLAQVFGLVHLPGLAASSSIAWAPPTLALENIAVRFGDVRLGGVFGIRSSLRRGAVTVARGPFSIGLGLDNGGAHLRLFGLKGWSEREARRVREFLGRPQR